MDYFDKIRSKAVNVTRQGNIDVITVSDGKEIPYCHIVALSPLTTKKSEEENTFRSSNSVTLQSHAALRLAIQHLNTGDGTVIKEIDGLNKTCPIRFTMEVIDTERSETIAVSELFKVLSRKTSTLATPLPCAFMGAENSAVSVHTSILTGILGYPQISAQSTSTNLNDKEQHKLFGRTIPSDDGTAVPVVEYFSKINIKHLGILFWNDAYGTSFSQAVQNYVLDKEYKINITAVGISSKEGIKNAIKLLASTQYRYFFAIIVGKETLDDIMLKASEDGITGPKFTWIFSDGVGPEDFVFDHGSELEIASRGASIIKAEFGDPDRLLNALKAIKQNNTEYIDSTLPTYEDDPTFVHTLTAELLKESLSRSPASLAYDAMIALGISACASIDDQTFYLNGRDHFSNFSSTKFNGTTGEVIFDNLTGTRNVNSVLYNVINMIPPEGINEDTGKTTFDSKVSAQYRNGSWEKVDINGQQFYGQQFHEFHGDLLEPQTNYMYIGSSLRIIGYLMVTIIVSMSVGFMSWTFWNRDGKVVKVSQPIFLYSICIGTILMGSSIIPLSFDDEIISISGCSIACMATPWLFFIGFSISFSSLIAKTRRINSIFHNPRLPRMQVSIYDEINPMFIWTMLNIMFLGAWTIVTPLQWIRRTISRDSFDRVIVSHGRCFDQNRIPSVLISLLNICGLSFVLHQVYLARHMKTRFSEVNYITTALIGMLLVILLGAPMIAMAHDNPQAKYFMQVTSVFEVCVMLLLFIFVPKVIFHRQIVKGKKSTRQSVTVFSEQIQHFDRI